MDAWNIGYQFCFLNPFIIVSFLILETNLETNFEPKTSKKELNSLKCYKAKKKRFRLIYKVKSLLFLEESNNLDDFRFLTKSFLICWK